MNINTNPLIDLVTWLNQWPRSSDIWTIHVDELQQWQPRNESYTEWMGQLLKLYEQACSSLLAADTVVLAMSLVVSEQLETFSNIHDLQVDFFTPPSLYLLNKGLEFPSSREQYFRLLVQDELGFPMQQGVAIVRSARNILDKAESKEFDNTLYIVSRFDEFTVKH
jgi:hypothetical protein